MNGQCFWPLMFRASLQRSSGLSVAAGNETYENQRKGPWDRISALDSGMIGSLMVGVSLSSSMGGEGLFDELGAFDLCP